MCTHGCHSARCREQCGHLLNCFTTSLTAVDPNGVTPVAQVRHTLPVYMAAQPTWTRLRQDMQRSLDAFEGVTARLLSVWSASCLFNDALHMCALSCWCTSPVSSRAAVWHHECRGRSTCRLLHEHHSELDYFGFIRRYELVAKCVPSSNLSVAIVSRR